MKLSGELRREALRAHERNQSFESWWPAVAAGVASEAQGDCHRFTQLVEILRHVTITGEESGLYAVGDDDALETVEDEQVDDVPTEARLQMTLFPTAEQYR